MPTVRRAYKAGYLRHLFRLVRNDDVTFEYRGLDLSYFEDQPGRFSIVKDAEAVLRELVFEGRHWHHARGPRPVSWYSLAMFALLLWERKNFCTPVPHGRKQESNSSLRVRKPVMFSYLADHLRKSKRKVREHLCCNAEEEIELRKVSGFYGQYVME